MTMRESEMREFSKRKKELEDRIAEERHELAEETEALDELEA